MAALFLLAVTVQGRLQTGMKGRLTGQLAGSLRIRMAVFFGLIVLMGCFVLGLVSEHYAEQALQEQSQEALLKTARQAAETLDSRIQARIYAVESIASRNVIRGRWGDREATLEEKLQALREEWKRAKSLGFKQLGIADMEGNAFFSDGSKARVADRDYFKAALEGKTAVSSTLVSRLDNAVVFVFSAPVRHYATGEVNGAVIGVMDGSRMSTLVSSINYGRTGYGFAVDNTGKVIAHKEFTRVAAQENFIEQARTDSSLKELAAVISRMAKGEEGVGRYVFQGQEKFIGFAPIKSAGWSVGINVPTAEVLERVAVLKDTMLLLSLLIILFALGLTLIMAGRITSPLVQMVDHLGLIASGDFTRPVPEKILRMKDEIGKLALAVDRLQDSVRKLLSGLVREAQTLAAHSQELAASTQQVSATVEELASTTSEVAATAEKGLENASRTSSESKKVVAVAESGGKTVKETIGKIHSIAASAGRMGESIRSLGELSARIGNITGIITGIADQTNLLALNAAIEAARAGEQGRGFAVVAEEVRKLAEQSAGAAGEIGRLVSQIQAGVEAAVAAMERGSAEVQEGVALASRAGEALEGIIDAVGKNIELVEEIIEGARQTGEGVEQLSASYEQVTSTIQQVAGATQELAEIAARLQSAANEFKI